MRIMERLIEKVHVISHTHWDREWYESFQGFRKRLVYFMDELLDVMENDERYQYFTLDGQTIMIDDYLEIRPENKARLMKLIQQGRIFVGPWYVMPDEFLVSGESLIRNLMIGFRRSRNWGTEPLKSGYVTDIFGHNSQLPQLLKGFNIDNAVLFRGFQGLDQPSELIWEGADGSRVIGLKLDEDRSYGDFYFFLRSPFAQSGFQYTKEEMLERAFEMKQYKAKRATTTIALGLDGVDHVEIEPKLPWMLDTLNESEDLNLKFVHSHMEAYLQELRPLLSDLQVYKGEQRSPGQTGLNNMVLANVLSSRVHLKQLNDACEKRLEHWAEPWGVFTELEGRPYPKSFLSKAWEYLIQNHPHDSICGCSIDQVHRDMLYRFDQSRMIADEMINDQLQYISNHIQTDSLTGNRLITVFNSCQNDIDGIVHIDFLLPSGSRTMSGGPSLGKDTFRLLNSEGEEVPYQIIDLKKNISNKWRPYRDIPYGDVMDRYTLAIHANVPAFGYQSFTVMVVESHGPAPGEYGAPGLAAPVRYAGSLRISHNSWDNGVMRVTVHKNGTISIKDHNSGREFNNLLIFEDDGDIGEGWNYLSPPNNPQYSSYGAHTELAVLVDGPLQTTLQLNLKMNVPALIAPDEVARSLTKVEMNIETTIELRKNDPLLRCRTKINNTARDHRVRLLFPTSLATEHFYTSTPFDLIERQVKQSDYSAYLESASDAVPHNGIIAIHDHQAGLLIVSNGLYETAIRENESTVAMTLFRSTRKEVLSDGSDGGQLLGELLFEYGIRVYSEMEVFPELLWQERQRFALPPRTVDRDRIQVIHETPFQRVANLPATRSFFSISNPKLIVSAIKASEDRADRYLVRMFNVSDSFTEGTLTFDRKLVSAYLVNLDEQIVKELDVTGNCLLVKARSKEIISIEVSFH